MARVDADGHGDRAGWMMRGVNERYLAQESDGLKRRSEERALACGEPTPPVSSELLVAGAHAIRILSPRRTICT